MNIAVRKYLSAIGQKGGRKSRRVLDPANARSMVKVREGRRAFEKFKTRCFWSYSPDLKIGVNDLNWVAEQLMKHGNREAWEIASRLCP